MRPREILPPVRTFCFDHFTVEDQISTRIKVRRFEFRLNYLQRVPYSKRAVLEESMINVARVFKVLQSCGGGMACREVLRHKIIRQAQCLHVAKLSLWFAQVHSVQNNISKVRDAQIGLHNCNTFRSNFNKLQ